MANIVSKLKTSSNNTEYSIRATDLFHCITTGSGQAYSAKLLEHHGNEVAFDSYQSGLSFLVQFHTAPTTAYPTLDVNSMGAVTLYWSDGQSPMGKIVANTLYLVSCILVNKTARFVITGPGDASGSGSGSAGKNVFTDSSIGTTGQQADGQVYLNHVVGTQVTSSELLTGNGDGIWIREEGGGILHLYNTSRLSISTNATTIGTPDTGNSNTYLNYTFANPDDSLIMVDSIKITGTGSTSVSYSNTNKTLTINSTGGGGGGNTDLILSETSVGTVHQYSIPDSKVHLNYIVNGNVARSISVAPGNNMIAVTGGQYGIEIFGPETRNVFSNSNIGTVNVAVGTTDTLYLNHVSNGFVVSSLAIVGAGPSITANNGVMTIHHSGGGGGSIVSFTEADFGVMGAFVGLLDVDGVQTPIAVEPARPDVVYNSLEFSRQGVVKPFVETRNAIPAYHGYNNNHVNGVITNQQLDEHRVYYVDNFDIKHEVNLYDFIALPVIFDYAYNGETNRFESVPYILLPSIIGDFDMVEFYNAGTPWDGDNGEDSSSGRNTPPIAPLNTFNDGDIWDSYNPSMV